MMHELLNTLYIQTQGAHASLERDTLRVELDGEQLLRVPLHHLGGIVAFGRVHLSGPLIRKCAEEGRAVVWLDENGRFKAQVLGKTSGNVLLRRDQWSAHFDEERTLEIARRMVAGKLQNARQVLLRGAREYGAEALAMAAKTHADCLAEAERTPDIAKLRGIEGLAASAYFDAFGSLVRAGGHDFAFTTRNRRPPRDRMNALLSFLYSLGTGDCLAALEAVGLDPQAGFLHVLRPGRASLALDLVEEFRAILLDRLALNLVNRKEVVRDDFDLREGGAVLLNERGRKKVLVAYQAHKRLERVHPLLRSKAPTGLLPHLQARLLARHLRGEAPAYTPWLAT